MQDPPVIFEAKIVRDDAWPLAIRQAVGQLYEYRHFEVADPDADLVFPADRTVPSAWCDYLEQDRQIGIMWPIAGGYHLSPLARAALAR